MINVYVYAHHGERWADLKKPAVECSEVYTIHSGQFARELAAKETGRVKAVLERVALGNFSNVPEASVAQAETPVKPATLFGRVKNFFSRK